MIRILPVILVILLIWWTVRYFIGVGKTKKTLSEERSDRINLEMLVAEIKQHALTFDTQNDNFIVSTFVLDKIRDIEPMLGREINKNSYHLIGGK